MADPRTPVDDLRAQAEKFRKIDGRLDALERPTGTQRGGALGNIERTLAYLASLKTYGVDAALFATGTVANDGIVHWFTTSPDLRIDTVDAPTRKFVVTVSCGEASITPGGSYVISYVGFSVYDANGINTGVGFRSGQRYTNSREGIGLTTFPQHIEIVDPIAHPGPYSVRALVGMWVATLNTNPCSTQFSDLSLVVQIIGDGVPAG